MSSINRIVDNNYAYEEKPNFYRLFNAYENCKGYMIHQHGKVERPEDFYKVLENIGWDVCIPNEKILTTPNGQTTQELITMGFVLNDIIETIIDDDLSFQSEPPESNIYIVSTNYSVTTIIENLKDSMEGLNIKLHLLTDQSVCHLSLLTYKGWDSISKLEQI